jgi:hypothetical protein
MIADVVDARASTDTVKEYDDLIDQNIREELY